MSMLSFDESGLRGLDLSNRKKIIALNNEISLSIIPEKTENQAGMEFMPSDILTMVKGA